MKSKSSAAAPPVSEFEWDEVITAPGVAPPRDVPKPNVRIHFTADEAERSMRRRIERVLGEQTITGKR